MNKKVVIIIICAVIAILGIGTYVYLTKEDTNTSLNLIEKKWIDNNKNQRFDISIYSNVPVFSYNGDGVVFDFLNSLESNTGLEFNKISYTTSNSSKSDYAFKIVNSVSENDILMYEDNYVLITLDGVVYNDPTEMKNIVVGVLNDNLDSVNNYLLGSDVTYKTYSDATTMIQSLESRSTTDAVDAIVLPKVEYLKDVLKYSDLTLGYNINEYQLFYVLQLSTNSSYSTLNSILTKYYKKWSTDNFNSAFNNYLMSDYYTLIGDSSQNTAKLHSKRYIYGFVNNYPYDSLNNKELIGIDNEIITNYAKAAGISIEYKEYDSIADLISAFNSNEIDFYLAINGGVEYKMDVFNTVSPFAEKMVILTKDSKNMIVNSVNSLASSTIGVLKGSKVASYLATYNLTLKEYDSTSELMKAKDIDVKAIDLYNYEYYVNKGLDNYRISYQVDINDNYTYAVRDISENEQFEKFFSFYLSFAAVKQMINIGITNSLNTNNVLNTLKNILIILICLTFTALLVLVIKKYKSKKHHKHSNLSKGDKLKYIDMLTSLKNRNYLNDNIELWDESEVYPQTIIIVDLNDVAYINDNYGHAEGDMVIKEAANILIKNQLPNSEILRTNGNEFLVYLVSYDEKEVVTYIKKLNKEFKDLAHGFGAAVGYSIITDAIKTIDDAINEATLDMKNNKEELSKD